MRRGYLTLTTPVALVLVILTAGCGGTPASPATETTTASADTTTQPANPDDLDGRYGLMPGTRLNIESTGASWPAGSGVLAVTKLDNGDLQLSAEAVTKRAGDRSWALDLTVTSIGRTVSSVSSTALIGSPYAGHRRGTGTGTRTGPTGAVGCPGRSGSEVR